MGYQVRPVTASVFRAYDIRGIVGVDLNEDAYYTIGLAFACKMRELGKESLFLGRDGRLSSQTLMTALARALCDSGMHVIDLGEVTTPVLYYATAIGVIDTGMMVTGSHNPAEYNGIKMVLAGKTLVREDIQALYQLVENQSRVYGVGQIEVCDMLLEYSARICADIKLNRPLRVVVDCGNGVGALTAPALLQQLGCEVIPLHCEVDGRFPNHHPDPTVAENLKDLQQLVKQHQADIGLAFDGDADRLGVITEKGEIIWPDTLMMFFAKNILAEVPGATIVYDVKCTSFLPAIIKQYGGQAIMCATGHSIVKRVMREEQAALAGEMSGHIFFKHRWYGFDDALYSAARLLEIMSHSPLSLSQQLSDLPSGINTPEIKIPITEDNKFTFMEKFTKQASFAHGELLSIDGVRVELPSGWGLLRASNTTPCLVARFEAEDLPCLRAIQELFYQQIELIDPIVAAAFKEAL